MTDNNGFADRDRIDLFKGSDSAPGHDTTPLPAYDSYPPTPDIPSVGADFWQPYDPGADPLAALDPAYPYSPAAYPPYPGSAGRYTQPQQHPAIQYPPAQYYANPYLIPPQQSMVPPRSNAMATGALVSSLVAYPAMFFCFAGALVAPVSVVLGVIALGQLKDRPYESGEGMAWSGIILGGLLTLLCIGLITAWVTLITG